MFKCSADVIFRIASTPQIADERVNVAFQNHGAPLRVVSRYRLRNASAAPPVTRKPSGILQVGVGAYYGVGSHAQIASCRTVGSALPGRRTPRLTNSRNWSAI